MADMQLNKIGQAGNGDDVAVVEAMTGVEAHPGRYDGRPGELGYQSIEFETYGLFIDDRPIPATRTRLAGWHTLALWEKRHNLELRSELHWRLSKIAILPVLMLLALALGYGGQGQNRVLMMVSALMTYFAYANLGGYLVALSRRGHAEPLALLWIVHLLVALLALYLFRRRAQNRALFGGNHGGSG